QGGQVGQGQQRSRGGHILARADQNGQNGRSARRSDRQGGQPAGCLVLGQAREQFFLVGGGGLIFLGMVQADAGLFEILVAFQFLVVQLLDPIEFLFSGFHALARLGQIAFYPALEGRQLDFVQRRQDRFDLEQFVILFDGAPRNRGLSGRVGSLD